jgi:hypothetical protein
MIKYDDYLSLAGLQSLFNHEVLAYVVKNYYHYENISHLCNAFSSNLSSSYEYDENKVSHIGKSSYEIDNREEDMEAYYSQVDKHYQMMQQLFYPDQTPIEKVNEDLSHIWSPGINLEQLHDKKMFAGVIRVIHKGSAIHAHQDLVSWSNPKAKTIHDIQGQFGMNYFMQVPQNGGKLLMWNISYDKPTFDKKAEGLFCIPIHHLPPPDIMIKPEAGMLVFLNTHYLHAIEKSIDSDRIASSCFIAYRGKSKALTYWT